MNDLLGRIIDRTRQPLSEVQPRFISEYAETPHHIEPPMELLELAASSDANAPSSVPESSIREPEKRSRSLINVEPRSSRVAEGNDPPQSESSLLRPDAMPVLLDAERARGSLSDEVPGSHADLNGVPATLTSSQNQVDRLARRPATTSEKGEEHATRSQRDPLIVSPAPRLSNPPTMTATNRKEALRPRTEVTVNIGQIEVKAAPQPQPARAAKAPTRYVTLQEYLKRPNKESR